MLRRCNPDFPLYRVLPVLTAGNPASWKCSVLLHTGKQYDAYYRKLSEVHPDSYPPNEPRTMFGRDKKEKKSMLENLPRFGNVWFPLKVVLPRKEEPAPTLERLGFAEHDSMQLKSDFRLFAKASDDGRVFKDYCSTLANDLARMVADEIGRTGDISSEVRCFFLYPCLAKMGFTSLHNLHHYVPFY